MIENTPPIHTERLVLRRFHAGDAQALLDILEDEEVNTFLPMFPLRTLQQAEAYLRERYLAGYAAPQGYRYAICLRADDVPIGYVHAGDGESRDFGYGLRRDQWHQGIVTEASRAVVARLRADGVPFITATHDVNNPRSGGVMKQIGMTYCYTYREQWQPKNFPVDFRMYQLNLDGQVDRVYRGYWDQYPEHWIEEGVT